MSRVAIIAAMAGELKPLVRGWAHERRSNVEIWRWRFDEGEWIAACGGAGVGAATRAFAEVEKDGHADLVISLGWAGALTLALETGRAYGASGVIDARTGERFVATASRPSDKNKDVARVGHPIDEKQPQVLRLRSAPLRMREKVGHPTLDQAEIPPRSQNRDLGHPDSIIDTPSLWLVTSPIVADGAEKRRLAAAYKAELVDMEAATVARLAQMRGIPFYCIKGVSDGIDDKLLDFNRFIRADGQFDLTGMVLFAILRPWHWPSLVRMGENSRKASQSMREAVLDFLDERAYIRERNGYPNYKH